MYSIQFYQESTRATDSSQCFIVKDTKKCLNHAPSISVYTRYIHKTSHYNFLKRGEDSFVLYFIVLSCCKFIGDGNSFFLFILFLFVYGFSSTFPILYK